MARDKYLSLEEARQSGMLEQFVMLVITFRNMFKRG